MKPEYELYQQIDNYLNGLMSEAESIEFAQQIANDTELAQQVKLQELTNNLLIEKRFNTVFAHAADNFEDSKTSFKNKLISTGIGLLVLSAGTAYYFSNNTEKTQLDKTIVNEQKVTITNHVDKINDNTTSLNIITSEKINKSFDYQKINKNTSDNFSKSNEIKVIEVVTNIDVNQSISNKAENINIVDSKLVETKTISSPCESIKISADLYSTPSCIGETNGKISVSTTSIKGGKLPYTFKLNNGDFQSNSKFEGLAEGQYNITIKDANDCNVELKEKVESKKCYKELNFSFNPQMGESWNYQPEINSAYQVKVVSKNGQVVWQNNNPAEQSINWQAISNTGEELNSGIYLYEINFVNGQSLHGTITILK